VTTPGLLDVSRLGIVWDEDRRFGRFPVAPRWCTSFGFLYGGSGIAAAAAAAEAATGRPLVWITTQFVANVGPGVELDIAVEITVAARATSQTLVRITHGEVLVMLATTAHTERPPGQVAVWGEMPAMPTPEDCEPFVFPHPSGPEGSFMDRLERRVEPGWADRRDGLRMWVRSHDLPVGSPASQAYVADIVPMGITNGLGLPPGATSLDNTLRVIHGDDGDGDWVLLDVVPEALRRSIGHGRVQLWRRDGALLGIASQTCIIRTSHHARSEGLIG
jgi:acyl-CoA thioesterase-2